MWRDGLTGRAGGATRGRTTGAGCSSNFNGSSGGSGAGLFVQYTLLFVGTKEMGPTAVGRTEGIIEIVGYQLTGDCSKTAAVFAGGFPFGKGYGSVTNYFRSHWE